MIINKYLSLHTDKSSISERCKISGPVESADSSRKRVFLMDRNDTSLRILACGMSKDDQTWEIITAPEVINGDMFLMAFDDNDPIQYNIDAYDHVALETEIFSYIGSDAEKTDMSDILLHRLIMGIDQSVRPSFCSWLNGIIRQNICEQAKYMTVAPEPFGTGIKTFVIDIDNNHGYPTYVGVRRIIFIDPLGNEIELVNGTDFTAYHSTQLATSYASWEAFHSAQLLTGSWAYGWLSGSSQTTNQRLICVFTDPQDIAYVAVHNCHHNGSYNTAGIKNCKMYVTDQIYTTTTHGSDAGGILTEIFSGELRPHIAANAEDPQECYDNMTTTLLDAAYQTIDLSLHPDIQQGTAIQVEGADHKVVSVSGNELLISSNLSMGFYPVECVSNMARESGMVVYSGVLNPENFRLQPTDVPMLLGEGLNSIQAIIGESSGTGSQANLYTAKSVIFDIADNWGYSDMGIRSVEFWLDGAMLPLTPSYYLAFATSTYNASYAVEDVFDTGKTKTGDQIEGWWSTPGYNTNQRLVCQFSAAIEFDKIVINNAHHNGGYTDLGAKNAKITISDDDISSTIYDEAVTNSTLIFDDVIPQHAVANVAHDLDTPIAKPWDHEGVKSVVFDFADYWGGVNMAIRSIDFYKDGVLIPISSANATTYSTTYFDSRYVPMNAFDTSLSKMGAYMSTQWIAADGQTANQRLIIVFDSVQDFDCIMINNNHHNGILTNGGIKNTKIHVSTDTIISTVYDEAITNSTLIFDGEIDQHIDYDAEDPQAILLTPPESTLPPPGPSETSVYHAICFDNYNTYKIWSGTAWRPVASKDPAVNGTDTDWHYRDGADTWSKAGIDNTSFSAINMAVTHVENQMDSTILNTLTATEYDAAGGFASANGYLDISTVMVSATVGSGANIESLQINGASAIYLMTPIPLESAETITDSAVIWMYDVYGGFDFESEVEIFAHVTGGNQWLKCTNGGSIPGITPGMDTTNKILNLKVITPKLAFGAAFDPAAFALDLIIK